MLNALFEGEGSHAPVFRKQRVPLVMGQGKTVHQTEGAPPALIGDCGCHAFRVQGFDAKAKSDQVLPVIAAQVDEFLVEQQVRYSELKTQLEHPVKQVTVQICGDLGTIRPLVEGQPSTEFPLQTVSVPSNVNSYSSRSRLENSISTELSLTRICMTY